MIIVDSIAQHPDLMLEIEHDAIQLSHMGCMMQCSKLFCNPVSHTCGNGFHDLNENKNETTKHSKLKSPPPLWEGPDEGIQFNLPVWQSHILAVLSAAPVKKRDVSPLSSVKVTTHHFLWLAKSPRSPQVH